MRMTMVGRRATAALAAIATACTAQASDDGADVGNDGAVRCTSSDQCNDGVDCTVDTCGVTGYCEYQPVDGLCTGAGERCLPGRGCVAGACRSSAECDDSVSCTTDTCGVGGTCQHTPLDALCDTGQRCDLADGCIAAGECVVDDDCDDDVSCTIDRCEVGFVCANTARDELCPVTNPPHRCNPEVGCYEYRECPGGTDAECQDGQFCNGREWCSPEFGCQPARSLPDCSDEDPCTVESCDADANMCVHPVDPTIPGCAPFDINGCYDLGGAVSQTCAGGMVNYRFNQICFEQVGATVLRATAPGFPHTLASPGGAPHAPEDLNFTVEFVYGGDCTETYRLRGTFTDNDHFDATWTAEFTPGGGFGCLNCLYYTTRVRGTRAP